MSDHQQVKKSRTVLLNFSNLMTSKILGKLSRQFLKDIMKLLLKFKNVEEQLLLRHNKMIWISFDNQKLSFCSNLSQNQPTALCFHLFAMVQTCAYLYSCNQSPQSRRVWNHRQMSFNKKLISRNSTCRQSQRIRKRKLCKIVFLAKKLMIDLTA